MSIFNVITLLGGLAMFLYGMRLMGDGLKEGSSGALKNAMEKLTNTPVKAFLLGLGMTAIIQSSTATIVITAGLVGAGIISLHQSLGIVVGANVGTTVTGQIIRLLDIKSSGTMILEFFKPSTLAPLAMIIGVIIIMSAKFKGAKTLGQVIIGFGILFSGLLKMTDAVSTLSESGVIEQLFSKLGDNPVIGYLIGAGVAFVLQSSSATIGILQAFSMSGQLSFSAIYAVLVGVYLGDCVTTAIVINIGSKPDAKRVGIMNIVYNLFKSAAILIVVTVLHKTGALNSLWNKTMYSGGIANTNTVFNLACAVCLFPLLNVFERFSIRIVKDNENKASEKDPKLDALNPVFYSTPALAFGRCYDLLVDMYIMARTNINRGFSVIMKYDEKLVHTIRQDEDKVDALADHISNYLIQLSGHIKSPEHIATLNQYYSVVSEFERLGDHATNLAEVAEAMEANKTEFSESAMSELIVLRELIERILDYSDAAFRKRDVSAAREIEPLEEVVDDMVGMLKSNHLERLVQGTCSVIAGTEFLNILSETERISDICSNVGIATIARAKPEIADQVHDYVSMLHAGRDEDFNRSYQEAHERYFRLLESTSLKK